MEKNNLIGLIILIAVIVIVFSIILFSSYKKNDVEVTVSDMIYKNNQYFVNISIINNQDLTVWISDTYFETAEGNIIDLTGAGIDKKVEGGEASDIQLFSANVTLNIIDSPITFKYTVFPNGKTYYVEI